MFGTTHRLVQQIRQQSSYGRTQLEQQLSKNVTASLISSLQELSMTFRKLQNTYLKSKVNLVCHDNFLFICILFMVAFYYT